MAFRYANGMTKEEYKAYYNALPDPQKTLSLDEWSKYRDMLARINNKAADEFRDAVFNVNGRWKGVGLGKIPADELIEYAYGLTTKYGEASGALAVEMYDEIAEASGVVVPAAAPAETASFSEVAKTVNGVLKQSLNEEMLAGAIERLTKLPAEDTMIQNSVRDGAELAWIPHGDTCAFCITLASRGWQPASQKMLRNGHAEHVHGHCDCTHAVRFNDSMKVEGYNPDAYLRREGHTKEPHKRHEAGDIPTQQGRNKRPKAIRLRQTARAGSIKSGRSRHHLMAVFLYQILTGGS